MQDHTSLRIVRPPGERAPGKQPQSADVDRAARPITPEEKRAFFKGVVIHCLDAGFLRYSRRQELLKVAAQLGINEFEACLLIAEAQFHSDTIDPAEAGDYAGHDIAPIAERLSISFTHIASALIAAAVVDVAIIYWLM